MYKFKKSDIPPVVDIDYAMNGTSSTVGRFGSRFSKYAGTSETFTKSVDVAGEAIDNLRTSAGMINEQKKGVDKIFLLSESAINAVAEFEKLSGVHQVDNLPVPTDVIRSSYGKKMGYAALVMTFLKEGMLHFQEEVVNLTAALEERDRSLSRLAAQVPGLEIIGAFEEINTDDLYGTETPDPASYSKKSPAVKTPAKKKN